MVAPRNSHRSKDSFMGDTPNIGTTHKRQKERKAAREFQDREQEQHTALWAQEQEEGWGMLKFPDY